MRTIVCVEPGKLERREMPMPDASPGLVAVDIRAIGICGTDFHILEGTHPFLAYPRVMGHELSGVVVGGAASPDLAPGTSVVINPYLSCGHCVACRKGKPNCCATLKVLGVHIDGGMCERVLMPAENLYPAGDLSLRDAAMIEFQAIGAHAVRRSELARGDRVLVVGAGPIGVGAAIFARLAGGEVTLMDISEAETGTMKLSVSAVDLAQLAAEVAAVYEDSADDAGVTFVTSVPERLVVRADRDRLRQALANLVDNAVKYTPRGGRVDVEARQTGGAVSISVRDTGTGIAEHEIPRIWDRLYRGDQSRTTRGLGLGLSLVRASVEAQGGHVTVSSQPGLGSAFTITLPN